MDGHDLLKQVMKNITAMEADFRDDPEHQRQGWYRADTYTAYQVEEMLSSLREVVIDGEEKTLHYDEARDSVSYIVEAQTLGITRVPHDGPICHTDMDGNVLKTEELGTSLTDAVPPWRFDAKAERAAKIRQDAELAAAAQWFEDHPEEGPPGYPFE